MQWHGDLIELVPKFLRIVVCFLKIKEQMTKVVLDPIRHL